MASDRPTGRQTALHSDSYIHPLLRRGYKYQSLIYKNYDKIITLDFNNSCKETTKISTTDYYSIYIKKILIFIHTFCIALSSWTYTMFILCFLYFLILIFYCVFFKPYNYKILHICKQDFLTESNKIEYISLLYKLCFNCTFANRTSSQNLLNRIYFLDLQSWLNNKIILTNTLFLSKKFTWPNTKLTKIKICVINWKVTHIHQNIVKTSINYVQYNKHVRFDNFIAFIILWMRFDNT